MALALIFSLPANAQLIQNGGFENWTAVSGTPPRGTPDGWGNNGVTPIQAPGLVTGSSYSAELKGGGVIYQPFAKPYLSSFQVSQVIAVNANAGWTQPLWITYQESGPDGSFTDRHDWILLRIAGSGSSMNIEARDGASATWISIADNVINTSSYDSTTNTFTTLNAYNIVLTYDAISNKYSISYGLVGSTLTTVSNLDYFIQPSNGSKNLVFASYSGVGDSGTYFAAVDNVALAVPETNVAWLLFVGVGSLALSRHIFKRSDIHGAL